MIAEPAPEPPPSARPTSEARPEGLPPLRIPPGVTQLNWLVRYLPVRHLFQGAAARSLLEVGAVPLRAQLGVPGAIRGRRHVLRPAPGADDDPLPLRRLDPALPGAGFPHGGQHGHGGARAARPARRLPQGPHPGGGPAPGGRFPRRQRRSLRRSDGGHPAPAPAPAAAPVADRAPGARPAAARGHRARPGRVARLDLAPPARGGGPGEPAQHPGRHACRFPAWIAPLIEKHPEELEAWMQAGCLVPPTGTSTCSSGASRPPRWWTWTAAPPLCARWPAPTAPARCWGRRRCSSPVATAIASSPSTPAGLVSLLPRSVTFVLRAALAGRRLTAAVLAYTRAFQPDRRAACTWR